MYYLQSRYYDPAIGRFINADTTLACEGGSVLAYNLYTYCTNNPSTFSDVSGNWPNWATKLVTAVAVVAVVAVTAVVTVATAGAGTVAAAIAVGAAKGAAVGMAVGAAAGAVGGAVNHRLTTGSWSGAKESALNGAGNGALSGAVTGAITGGVTGGISHSTSGQGYDTFKQLKNALGSPGDNNEWHHIVEQSQIAKSGFTPQQIHNTNNIIAINKNTHRSISGYYTSKQPFTNGLRVRDWLAGQSYEAQYKFGLKVIEMFK